MNVLDDKDIEVKLTCIAVNCVHNVSNVTGIEADLFCNLKHVAVGENGACMAYVNLTPDKDEE